MQNIREEYWIRHFNSRDPAVGYNIDTGGYLGPRSEIARQNISKSNKNIKKRQRISNSLMNHEVLAETKEKIRLSTIKTMTPERILFQRKNMLGRKKMRSLDGECSYIKSEDIQTHIDKGWTLCVSSQLLE